jgi:hypothetical protein
MPSGSRRVDVLAADHEVDEQPSLSAICQALGSGMPHSRRLAGALVAA